MDHCPFCESDPYHYVDIGVGFERAAIVCCDAGIELLQNNNRKLWRMVDLAGSNDRRRARRGDRLIARVRRNYFGMAADSRE